VTYATPGSWRQAVEARLSNQARATGVDLDRLRRRLVVGRILVRLENHQPGRWILKGGMALEFRIGDRARATRDLDVVVRNAQGADETRAALIACLATDPDEDRFEFIVGQAETIEPDEAGRPGWRFGLEARVAGREFARVRIDVVARADEITNTERLLIGSELTFAGIQPTRVEVVDQRQHFAEKLHAYTRDYGDRLNSRVRDLPDMVVLIHDGLDPDAALRTTVGHVFDTRGTHPLPEDLPDPPAGWRDPYESLAAELDLAESTIDAAMETLRGFWSAAREFKE